VLILGYWDCKSEIPSFEMWCWRRIDWISWTDPMKDEEVLHRVKEENNILHTIKKEY
jgi:hypothetical protein